jgi:ABC-type transporter Mla maintaining outer membrane lipid asymmetry ATPase subunit MlaF
MKEAPTESGIAAIEMRGVSVASLKSPTTTVAAGVSWTVKAGEFWVIGAPQHSGKTDFLMTVAGIMAPAGGEYLFLGEPMPIFEEPRMAHRLKLGFVFDGGQLLGHLTVAENIALPLRYHGRMPADETEARVQELLEAMELTPWANNTPTNVGRSWRQRAGLARALALQPEVLLVDSPLTGLDVRHAWWWLGMLGELSRGHPLLGGKPMTIVVTADDLRPWRKQVGQVACLVGGRLSVLGDWPAVERSPDQAVQELLHDEVRVIDRNRGI